MGEIIAEGRMLSDRICEEMTKLDGTGWVYGGGVNSQRVGMAFHFKPGMDMLSFEDIAGLDLYDEEGMLKEGFIVDFSPLIDNHVIMYEGAPSESLLEFIGLAAKMNPARTHLHMTHEMLRGAFNDWIMGTYSEAKTIGDVAIAQFLAPPADQSCAVA